MVTIDQQEQLGYMMVYTELWLSTWQKLIDSGYIPRQEIKFHGKNFKNTLEKLQAEMFNAMAQKMSKEDALKAESQYLDKIKSIEMLVSEYSLGNVKVELNS